MKMPFLILVLFFICLPVKQATAQSTPVFMQEKTAHWADSVLNTLSYRQKIGQLFMAEAYSNKDSFHVAAVRNLIDSFEIGGLIVFQGGPMRWALLTNDYQRRSKLPLLMSIDGEWGLNMRLDSTVRFPRQMTMSAAGIPQHVYEMGTYVGYSLRRMGIHINFAPTIDINNNPANPVINSRSFGEKTEQVALLGSMYMKGMQDHGVLACGKHFPGHGNTDTDSHLSLPTLHNDRATLDSVELVPFKALIKDSLASVMVAHLSVPAIDTTAGLASSLSKLMVDSLLKKDLGFRGLVFTDALNMKGVASYFKPGELEVRALQAGNDILLCLENVPRAFESIHLAIQNCELDQADIDAKVRKILMAKAWLGLDKGPTLVDTTNLIADLNRESFKWLDYQLYEHAVTLLRNKGNHLPLDPCRRDCLASLVLNDSLGNTFQSMITRYGDVHRFALAKDASPRMIDSVLNLLDDYDHVIVSLHNTSTNASKNFNLTDPLVDVISRMAHRKGSIFCLFGNAYVLGKLEEAEHYNALVLAYEDSWYAQYIVAQKLFGVGNYTGHLPVSPTALYREGMGMPGKSLDQLKYTFPPEVGLKATSFASIDSIVNQAIRDSVMPGCQVLMALHGKVIYDKAFGYKTYDKVEAVQPSDLYDIASVTKMAGTALAVMHLVDRHKLEIDAKASKYLAELRHSNKKDLTLRQIMAHQAGLQAWIPFWKNTVDSTGQLRTDLYRSSPEKNYRIPVADSLFLLDDYADSLWLQVVSSSVNPPGKYVYSDLGMLIMQRIVEKVSGKSLPEYLEDNFYKPLGLPGITYNPLDRFPADKMVPTENDTAFRHQMLRGYVHDPAAAMLGGVAGHAGLFANAHSLAVVMQMLLNDGTYRGHRYIQSSTIDAFTSPAFPGTANRRGLIFDKPDGLKSINGPTAPDASHLSFGHSGFTGTCAWADPETGLVYIFLSNRVCPDAANNKLAKQNIRSKIMQVAYDALKSGNL